MAILLVPIILHTDSLIMFPDKLVSEGGAADASKYTVRGGRSSDGAFIP